MLRYYVNLKVSCQNGNMEIFLGYVFFQFRFFQYITTKKNCCICNIFSFLEKKKWPSYPTPHSFPTHLTKTPFPQHFPTTTTLKTPQKNTLHSTTLHKNSKKIPKKLYNPTTTITPHPQHKTHTNPLKSTTHKNHKTQKK